MLSTVLLSQFTVSSSITAKPSVPFGEWYRRQEASMWSAVCSSAPHLQVAKGTKPHLCIVEQNSQTPVHTLNHLCTDIGLFHSTMHKWGLVPLANCRCRTEKQMADHILASCPLYHTSNGTLGLAALNEALWTGSKELHSTSDDKISPNEEFYPKDAQNCKNVPTSLVCKMSTLLQLAPPNCLCRHIIIFKNLKLLQKKLGHSHLKNPPIRNGNLFSLRTAFMDSQGICCTLS